MSDWQDQAPGRGLGFVVIFGTLALITGFIAGLPSLLTPPDAIDVFTDDPGAQCDDARRGGVVRVRSTTLFSCPERFDGRTVTVVGETIGNLFSGPDDRRWVQVNDDVYSRVGSLDSHHQTLGTNSGVAVLLPQGRTPQMLGGPGAQGDLLEVTGEFQLASPADQGGPAIIADRVTTTGQGKPVANPPARRLQLVTPVMVVITAVLGLAVWWRRRNR
jgi:hypothetical protein